MLSTHKGSFLLLGLLLLCAATDAAGQSFERSYAVVIGIDQYPSRNWENLQYAVKDAQGMGRFLRSQGFSVTALYNQDATRRKIISTLEDDIAPRLQSGDRVVVFFAGHGETKRRARRDWGYLVPYDGEKTSGSLISMEALRSIAEKMGSARHLLFIMDACFGGYLVTRGGPSVDLQHPYYLQEVSTRHARQVLTAGGKGQRVLDQGPNAHSYFTSYLLRALEQGQGDLNGDGYIMFHELASYLVPAAPNRYQTPTSGFFPGHEGGEFLFRNPRGGILILPSLPEKTEEQTRSQTQETEGFILKAQESLREAGFDPGPPDGIWGQRTRNAVVAFQRAYGLPVTGRLDDETWTKLESLEEEKIRSPDSNTSTHRNDREEMVSIPAGEFWMGCNEEVDQECYDDEKPGRRVYLDTFSIDPYEVTVTEYRECVQAGRCSRVGCNYNESGRDNHPINCVDWNQAQTYCAWVGKRLPTEAEWEKAARGTDGQRYPWGNEWDSSRANTRDGGPGRTSPVGSYPSGASPYGVHDMAGNVLEWVQNWYDADYYQKRPSQNPQGPDQRQNKVLRGGSWRFVPGGARVSYRYWLDPGYRYDDIGFRCAR